MTSPIARLIEFGQSPWYDNLTRALARGGLRDLVARARHPGRHVEPDDLREGDGDGLRLRRAAARARQRRRVPTEAAYWALVEADIADAADILRPHYDEWRRRRRVRLDRGRTPTSRTTPTATLAQAQDLFGRLGRPNVMIKIPATREGLPAITARDRGRYQRQHHA